MRMRCLQKHGSVGGAFASVEEGDWTHPLSFDGFRDAVHEMGLVARDRDKVDKKLSQVRQLAVSLGADASVTSASFEAIGQKLENIFELLDTRTEFWHDDRGGALRGAAGVRRRQQRAPVA
ncbi:unnamed protein product [Prorocentrum cordatum]|uniref:Uncharacterized protein n=1 Tax=Prorocentrum cordatum TaxID=2364126 RepID=A0ABN9S944_9DINO|nr:unnamed protein product [Polarella glacialis]